VGVKLGVKRAAAGGLKGGSPESDNKEVYLDEDKSETFDTFVTWIQIGDITPSATADLYPFLHAYMLADRFCMPVIKNDPSDAIRTPCGKHDVNISVMLVLQRHEYRYCKPTDFLMDQTAYVLPQDEARTTACMTRSVRTKSS
jgi:hypothetical protein